MQTIISKTKTIKAVAFIVICASLFSFSNRFGGEGFEIFLNNKLVLQHYGTPEKSVKSLQLDQANYNDQLTIKYYHCGKIGRNRTVILKDEKNNVLKQWYYADTDDVNNMMSCKVKDILDVKKRMVVQP